MRFIWGKKEFTLMIIPGADRRTVRIKLPQSSLYIVPSVMLLVLVGFFVTIYLMNTYFHQTTNSMQQTFDGQERKLVDQIMMKESELVQLQSNLLDLSQQAEEFKGKLEDIRKLKRVVQLMTQPEGTSKPSSGTAAASAPPAVSGDMGGAEAAVTHDAVARMVSDTKQDLTTLVGDINELLANLTESEAKLEAAAYLRSITPTLWPASSHSITSGFGIRRDPFTQKPSMHAGIDFDGELNDPAYATAAGKVVVAGYDSQHGNHIVIDHTRGLQTEYMHLNKLLVKRGDAVTKGQKIGLIGTTGRSTGTHLHYEVHKNGVQIDPTPYLISDRKDES